MPNTTIKKMKHIRLAAPPERPEKQKQAQLQMHIVEIMNIFPSKSIKNRPKIFHIDQKLPSISFIASDVVLDRSRISSLDSDSRVKSLKEALEVW